jgi:hypothetical protein
LGHHGTRDDRSGRAEDPFGDGGTADPVDTGCASPAQEAFPVDDAVPLEDLLLPDESTPSSPDDAFFRVPPATAPPPQTATPVKAPPAARSALPGAETRRVIPPPVAPDAAPARALPVPPSVIATVGLVAIAAFALRQTSGFWLPAYGPMEAPIPPEAAAALAEFARPAPPPGFATPRSPAPPAPAPAPAPQPHPQPPPGDEALYAGRPLAWWNERLRVLAAQPGEEARRMEALTLSRAEGVGLRRRASAATGDALEAPAPEAR